METKDLVINVTSSEIAIALLENRRLVELNQEKSNIQFAVGDIYLGKIKKIMPGLNASFVDVGYEKDAFLHYLDLGAQFKSLDKYTHLALLKKGRLPAFNKFRPEQDIEKEGKISDVLRQGKSIVVQITKEPISTKGPRLSSEISLAGRNLVLIPFSDKVSVSQKIESVEEKNRLKTLLQSIKPQNYGVIVRTVAEGKKVAVLDAELRSLVKKWESAVGQLKEVTPPRLIISELSRTSAILRDILNVSFNSIHVNSKPLQQEIRDYIVTIAPEKQKIVKYYKGKADIFDRFGVNKQIKSLFGRTVSFKNGAYLIIEHTEALHVIDVNSGTRSKSGDNQETNALEVNLSAAEEIARQLRLRDMGGIIVVDFIDMQTPENKQMLFEKMKEIMASDRTKHNILPLSKFGLMQITRQRVRPEMNIETIEKCPSCNGTGEISPSILYTDELEKTIGSAVGKYKLSRITIKTHPYIAAYLEKGFLSVRKRWSKKYKCTIKVMGVQSYNFLEFHLFDKFGDEIIDL
ncbi:MAG: Rne/Rng family ribonuclease [Bacteroidales bacterium]|nr:MAG: Rne/Rng family ribonuclease [Bacteroidales bacterium]